jgi:hypothetical protein
MVTSRGVLAIMTAGVFLLAIVALRRDAGQTAAWLLAIGSALGTVWSLLSMFWAENHASMAPPDGYLSLAVLGAVTTVYFGLRAKNRAGAI